MSRALCKGKEREGLSPHFFVSHAKVPFTSSFNRSSRSRSSSKHLGGANNLLGPVLCAFYILTAFYSHSSPTRLVVLLSHFTDEEIVVEQG